MQTGSLTIDARILKALRGAEGGSVSGVELSEELGLTRAAIWARIEDLRSLGYEIQAGPHLGYKLVTEPDLLHADNLLSRLGQTTVIGRDIHVFQETTSTNDIVEKLARDGVNEGAAVFAETQTKGRGRLGRRWFSSVGKGLCFSVLLRPSMPPQEVTQLTVASGAALRRAIETATGLSPEIKWPNDILVNDRKVAGILTEMKAELDQVSYVILGIGVDVNLSATDFPADLRKSATSLKIESGRIISRSALAVAALKELDADYARLRAGKFEQVAGEWERHCTTIGHQVTIRTGERKFRGCAESLGEDGALLVRTDHGHLERVVGGDVTLER